MRDRVLLAIIFLIFSASYLLSTLLIFDGPSVEILSVGNISRLLIYSGLLYLINFVVLFYLILFFAKNKRLAAILCFVVFVAFPGSITLLAGGVLSDSDYYFYSNARGVLFDQGKLTPAGYEFYLKGMMRDLISGIAYLGSFWAFCLRSSREKPKTTTSP